MFKVVIAYHLATPLLEDDSSSYLLNVYRMLENNWPLFHTRPPGYSLFILLIWELLGRSYYAIIYVQILLSAFAWTMLYHTLRTYISSKLIAIYLLLISCIPFLWFEDFFILSESLSLSLFIISIALFGMAVLKQSQRKIFWTGIFISLTCLTKLSLIASLLWFFPLAYIAIKSNGLIRGISLSVLVPGILFLSLSVYNKLTIDTYSLFSFGSFNRMISVRFALHESDGQTIDQKQAITHLNRTLVEQEKNVIDQIQSPFESNSEIQAIYIRNSRSIYSYYDYMDDSLHLRPEAIYASCIPLVESARRNHPTLYYNFIYNNLLLFIDNTGQCRGSVTTKINAAHTHFLSAYNTILYANHRKQKELLSLVSESNADKKLPSLFEKLFEGINKIFRQKCWWGVLCALTLLITYHVLRYNSFLKEDPFLLSLLSFFVAYTMLVITSGIGSVERYSLFTDLVLYITFPFLIRKIIFMSVKKHPLPYEGN